jgi:hypothetical protein
VGDQVRVPRVLPSSIYRRLEHSEPGFPSPCAEPPLLSWCAQPHGVTMFGKRFVVLRDAQGQPHVVR